MRAIDWRQRKIGAQASEDGDPEQRVAHAKAGKKQVGGVQPHDREHDRHWFCPEARRSNKRERREQQVEEQVMIGKLVRVQGP